MAVYGIGATYGGTDDQTRERYRCVMQLPNKETPVPGLE